MKRFTTKGRNEGFLCANCGNDVPPLCNGSYRNHCPHCLYSLHVDIMPGDRLSPCKGLLVPVGVEYNGKKGWVIISQCQACDSAVRNVAALDDPECPDDYEEILQLASNPK